MPILEQIADNTKDDAQDRLKAIDLLGKYGLDARTQMAVDDVRERLRATVALILDELGPEVAERLIARIHSVWST